MYSKGISSRDIEDQLRDIYGVDVSESLISAITKPNVIFFVSISE
jgi:putative transposase